MDFSSNEDTNGAAETTSSEETADLNVTAESPVQAQASGVEDDEDKPIYKVVVNHEEHYSIWPASRENPRGWRDDGKSGTKAECLEYIDEVWTDMRPLSLRRKMEAMQGEQGPAKEEPATEPGEADPRDDLVGFLAEGEHPVEAGLRPEKTVKRLREAIDRGYVQVRFTDTRGGAELGVRLDTGKSDFAGADFEKEAGAVHLVGDLRLNYVKVRCIADIELANLTGTGHLERLEDDEAGEDHDAADVAAPPLADDAS